MIEYSWALLRFFYRLPSWLFYSSLGEVGVFFSYMIVSSFLGSFMLLVIFILGSLLLPERWFHERFVSRSILPALLGLGYLIYVNWRYPAFDSYPLASYTWVLTVVILIVVFTFLIDRVALLRTLLEEFANRMVVFLYLIVPISIVSLLIVMVRNVF